MHHTVHQLVGNCQFAILYSAEQVVYSGFWEVLCYAHKQLYVSSEPKLKFWQLNNELKLPLKLCKFSILTQQAII